MSSVTRIGQIKTTRGRNILAARQSTQSMEHDDYLAAPFECGVWLCLRRLYKQRQRSAWFDCMWKLVQRKPM